MRKMIVSEIGLFYRDENNLLRSSCYEEVNLSFYIRANHCYVLPQRMDKIGGDRRTRELLDV